MKNNNMRWVLLIIVVLIFMNITNQAPKLAVADVEGKVCAKDADCPCVGVYNVTGQPMATATGIGTGSCRADTKTCDMQWCIDVAPVGQWIANNPWEWIKDNILIFLVLIGLTFVIVLWPDK